MVINDGYHDEDMNNKATRDETCHSNVIALSVVRMEYLYHVHDKLERVTNYKTKSSIMQYEMINLGFEKDPNNVNLGLGCTPTKLVALIKLFKEYKDVFSWTYDDLNTCNTRIIQHVILMDPDAKPY